MSGERSAASRWSAPSGPPRLDGQVAVITGASRGICFSIAETFVAAGASVVITGRNEEPLAEAAAALGERARYVAGSAAQDGMAERTCAVALEAFGRLDILVNGAATNPQFGPLIDADLAAVDKVFATNLRAPIVWSQAAWRAALRDHGGVIVNLASAGGIVPTTDLGAYSVSKAGLIHLTRLLAVELAPAVRVNALAPAVVRTQFAAELLRDEEAVLRRFPIGRPGEPADVAQAALYLASPASSWVTGVTITLDGGEMAARRRV